MFSGIDCNLAYSLGHESSEWDSTRNTESLFQFAHLISLTKDEVAISSIKKSESIAIGEHSSLMK